MADESFEDEFDSNLVELLELLWNETHPLFLLLEREPVTYTDCSWLGVYLAFDVGVGMSTSNKLQRTHHFLADGLLETILKVFEGFCFSSRVHIVLYETDEVVTYFFDVQFDFCFDLTDLSVNGHTSAAPM